jgi:hypothetical protein
LCLSIGASSQRLAGDPYRKSEVVLDSRARARLAPRRTGFDHERIESLGSRINRGRKARRSSADDDDIAQLVLIDPPVEAETLSNLLIGGVPQNYSAAD